jgi:hypothetical protein
MSLSVQDFHMFLKIYGPPASVSASCWCRVGKCENAHWVRHVDPQVRWSINVWGGIIGEHVLGPHFFEGHLNGQMYLEFLRNECTMAAKKFRPSFFRHFKKIGVVHSLLSL